jgi:hypothetical protein
LKNFFISIDFYPSAQKSCAAAEGGQKKQNTEFRIQNSKDSKHKGHNHKKLLSAKGGNSLFNSLFDLDLLDLKPCSAERYAFIY